MLEWFFPKLRSAATQQSLRIMLRRPKSSAITIFWPTITLSAPIRPAGPGWHPPYSHLDTFHEPLVLFAYFAGLTKKIEFATGIIILPQRQTVLVAKQAAALDVLSGGRLRFGVGIGWNPVEYEALG